MADTKISALTAATTPLAGTEVLPIVQGGVTKQVSVADLTAGRAVSASSLTLTNALTAANGGTGQSSYTIGDILYASGATALSKLADVATGNALISGGVGAAPSWGKIGLTTHVSGTLPVGNGGTGTATAFTAGSVVFAGASGVYSQNNSKLFWDNTNSRLGIGTASPAVPLHVSGQSRFADSSSSANYLTIGIGADAPYGNASISTTTAGLAIVAEGAGNLTFRNNGAECARFDSSQNFYVEVAATTASAANVFIDTTTTPSGQIKRSTSSLRYKTNIQDLTHGLNEVMRLRPVTYQGKNDGENIFGGLIAEEVDAIGLKEFVAYDNQGRPDSISYGNMVALLIKAIQEQQNIIQQLNSDVNSLKGK